MSNNTHFNGENLNPDQKHQEEVIQYPEFTLIDDRNGNEQQIYFGSDSPQGSQDAFEKEAQAKQSKSPLSLRFICLLGFIFCVVFGLGMLLWSVVMTTVAMFSLFLNTTLNKRMFNFWKLFLNTCIALFGFTLGMMSPTLGISLLAIYFSLAGNLVEDDFLRRVIRRSFNHF